MRYRLMILTQSSAGNKATAFAQAGVQTLPEDVYEMAELEIIRMRVGS